MSIVIIAPGKNNLQEWQAGLKKLLAEAGHNVPVYTSAEQIENKDRVKMAITWKHPKGSLQSFTHLQLVASMGAGVDHIIQDDTISRNLKIVRVKDDQLAQSMTEYVLAQVLAIKRRLAYFRNQQQQKVWAYTDKPEREIVVGILGLGQLGMHTAKHLQLLGIPVRGYAQSSKFLDFPTYTPEELKQFLSKVNVLICMLPLTATTNNMLNSDFFNLCNKNTILINVARGKIVHEPDLVTALNNGNLESAILDVFEQEPLPENHPFWSMPNVTITPHISSITNPLAAIPQLANNYINLIEGEPLKNEVSWQKQY